MGFLIFSIYSQIFIIIGGAGKFPSPMGFLIFSIKEEVIMTKKYKFPSPMGFLIFSILDFLILLRFFSFLRFRPLWGFLFSLWMNLCSTLSNKNVSVPYGVSYFLYRITQKRTIPVTSFRPLWGFLFSL